MARYKEYRVRFYDTETAGGVTVSAHYAVERLDYGYWSHLRLFEHPWEAAAYAEHLRAEEYQKHYGTA